MLVNVLKQIYGKTLDKDITHSLKNSYQLILSLNKFKRINSIVVHDFKYQLSNLIFMIAIK